MRRRTAPLLSLAAMSILSAAGPAVAQPGRAVDHVRANARAIVLGSATAFVATLNGGAAADLRSMRPDGSWSDVDYADVSPGKWKAAEHLTRLERIARAYYRDHQGGADVPARLGAGLTWWLDHDLKNPNWWMNEINTPREFGYILVMMGDDAPPALRERGAKLMERAAWGRQTGANLVDETWIQVLRGCVSGSPAVVAQAFDRTWQELRVVGPEAEGIQADGTFHQHGHLLYNQGYGTVLLECVLRFLTASDGTPYGPPTAAMAAFDRFAVDADPWMFRGETFDWGVCGRGICRPGSTRAAGVRKMLAELATHPSPRAAELSAELVDPGPVGNRHFWCSDYMVQRRPDYFASVRMYSTRTANTDALTNDENRKSHHIADGATCLMCRGDEYLDIYPVWDWLGIPGTTVEQNTPFPQKRIKRTGKSDFVGGASDGSVGCAAMDLVYDRLQANKAWFCFDHAMVCLGTGITCGTPNPVMTTLNQCLLHGPVYAAAGPVSPGHRRISAPGWLWHDGIGYVWPTPATVDLKIGPQRGAWSDIGTGSAATVTKDVFDLAIDHGPGPRDAGYAYVLLPGSTQQQTAAAAARLPVDILSNTPRLQAVWEPATGVLQAVFHQPGTAVAGDVHVSVDRPCLLVYRRDKGTVSVSNPLNAADTVTVRVDGRAVRLDLPGGMEAGSTVTRPVGP